MLGWRESGANANRLTLRVPEEYPQIQDAIEAAPEGATILIGPGKYLENLVITKSLTLQGAGPKQTIIQGTDQPFSSDNSITRFITLFINGQDPQPLHLTLRGLKIEASKENNTPAFHTAVELEGDFQVLLQGNHLVGQSGVKIIDITGGSQLSLWQNQIEGSFLGVDMGGYTSGLYGHTFPFQLFMRDNTIQMDGDGTGLSISHAPGSTVTLVGDKIQGGTGIDVDNGGQISVLNAVIHGNDNGIILYGGQLSIWHSVIEGARENGISVLDYNWGLTVLEVQYSKITGNQGYGVVLEGHECYPDMFLPIIDPHPDPNFPPRIVIEGWGNTIADNGKGDICPADYPGLWLLRVNPQPHD